MPTFTFEGFPIGSSVSLTALQNGLSRTGSVPNWGAGVADIDITVTAAPRIVAPAVVWFDAVNPTGFALDTDPGHDPSYDPAFHQITYAWQVRTTPLPAYQYVENMIPAWNDANLAWGPQVALRFPDAGTYTVDLWAYKGGAVGYREVTVVVEAADEVYPGNQTYCVSQASDFSGAPAGALTFSSIDAAIAAMPNSTANPGRRLLLRAGETFAETHIFIAGKYIGDIGAFGPGAKPVLVPRARESVLRFDNGSAQEQFKLHDIRLQGRWNAATETGFRDYNPLRFREKPGGAICEFVGVEIDGFDTVESSMQGGAWLFADGDIGNWANYGSFFNSSQSADFRLAFFGCRIAQHVDALNGGDKNGAHNNHACLRMGTPHNVYLGVLDLFSRTGWSALGSDRADQPTLRLNHLGSGNQRYNVERIVSEGGFTGPVMQGQNANTIEHPGNYLVDRMVSIASTKTIGKFLHADYGGTTVRNLLGILPDVPLYHKGNSWSGGVTFEPSGPPHASNANAPIALYSSTFLSLRRTAFDAEHGGGGWAFPAYSDPGPWNFATFENNVVHAPDMVTPVTYPGIDLTGALPGVTLRYKGVLYGFNAIALAAMPEIVHGAGFTLSYSALTQGDRADLVGSEVDGSAATDQAYWQTYGGSGHLLVARNQYNNGEHFGAVIGDFTVDFGAGEITVTNTSGVTWHAGDWVLKLDRHAALPAMDETGSSFGMTLPLPRAPAGSSTGGRLSRSDLLCNERPTVDPAEGAVEAV